MGSRDKNRPKVAYVAIERAAFKLDTPFMPLFKPGLDAQEDALEIVGNWAAFD